MVNQHIHKDIQHIMSYESTCTLKSAEATPPADTTDGSRGGGANAGAGAFGHLVPAGEGGDRCSKRAP